MHDISTDLEDPPPLEAALPLRAGLNPVTHSPEKAQLQRGAYADVGPLFLRETTGATFARALEVARGLGWQVLAIDPARGRIEAVDTTLLFGFQDDVVVRVRPAGAVTRVDVRSVSRVGKSDLGTNAGRVRKYLRELAARP